MLRKSRVLLAIGFVAGIAILANISFRAERSPSNPENALSLGETDFEQTGLQASQRVKAEVAALIEERRELDETVWAQEVAAQKHEETIVKYWDQMLRPEDDKYAVLAEFPFDTITLDRPGETTELEWGIKLTTYEGQWKTLDRAGWRKLLREMQDGGYSIDAIEFHQSSYDVDSDGNAESVFNILLNVVNKDTAHRWTVNSKLRIEWTGEVDGEGLYVPGDLTVFDTKILEREGPRVFEHRVLKPKIRPISHPVVYDQDRDGFSDILLPGHNMVLRNRGDGQFDELPLFLAPGIAPPTNLYTATAADFDGDGYVDLLCTALYTNTLTSSLSKNTPTPAPSMRLILFRGDAAGQFLTPGKSAASSAISLTLPMCATVGDIDGDGDLDLWLAQYKNPYKGGQMPTPFYDANDGHPSYLLLNRGDGVFDDVTEAAGLAPKRYRRTFAASFVDLDDDHDLDLLVSSDFAGTDIYFNDGTGHFTDETHAVLEESANFAMGHTFADYNQDGALDFYVLGMGSTTMRRLNQMGLIREDRPEYLEMRTRMGYGNRMYLAQGKRAFRQPEFRDSVARSGWSWGTTSFDFDSDGDMDVYVANGHVSGNTTKDYCSRFWCHDIYTGDSKSSPVLAVLFKETYNSFITNNISWDGYQKNHLFMNRSGEDFVNVAFLMNVALGEDARSVISDDFNGDGRPDLLVTSAQGDWARALHLFINHWPIRNNWIGVRLQIEAGGPSTIGAVIRVRSNSGEQLAHIVTGDSFRAQHAPMKHFGLGSDTAVDSIEIRWPDGTIEVMKDPAINTYHVVSSSTAR